MRGDCENCKHWYQNKIDLIRLTRIKKKLVEALAEIGDDII